MEGGENVAGRTEESELYTSLAEREEEEVLIKLDVGSGAVFLMSQARKC